MSNLEWCSGPYYRTPSGEKVKIVFVSTMAKTPIYFALVEGKSDEADLRQYRANELTLWDSEDSNIETKS